MLLLEDDGDSVKWALVLGEDMVGGEQVNEAVRFKDCAQGVGTEFLFRTTYIWTVLIP